MPMMRLKEIRSAVTHMRQYSSGGCGEKTQDQHLVRLHGDPGTTDCGTPYEERQGRSLRFLAIILQERTLGMVGWVSVSVSVCIFTVEVVY